ncbi:hypothetical protein M3Y97_00270500 [Aphelenchoides bicaudatus]|nr:hypothetical protein M3Y97_00270500 [Aphelenchoides bicaudatus]
MIVLLSVLRTIVSSDKMKRVKPISLHFSLFVFIFVYAFCGGLLFTKIETDAAIHRDAEIQQQQHDCIVQKLSINDPNVITAGETANKTASAIADCFRQEVDIRSQWGIVTGTLYGFGIVTTLGYNRIAPITTAGRLLCITMIIIANLGQYFNGFASVVKKKAVHFKLLAISLSSRPSKTKLDEENPENENEEESSTELISFALLVAFLLYIVAGSLFLPLLNGEFDFLNGIYYNFLVLTAIDFGALVPTRVEFLPITFLYVCIGLAITTLAIEIGSTYLKKLHHLGQNLKNVAQQKIWFGGKQLKVRDLLHAVGKKAGVDPSVIDNLDLENIVERTVAINEGRTPPPDTNEDDADIPGEPEPSPPSPPIQEPPDDKDIEKQPLIQTIKRPIVSILSNSLDRTPSIDLPPEKPPYDLCNFVAIDADFPDELHQIQERNLDLRESVIVSQTIEETVSAQFIAPAKVEKPAPIVILQDTENKSDEDEPRKFLEKKQKYGRDAKKLYATYQEEWDRLEGLSKKRLGSRRRSVLASDREGSASSANSSRAPSPVPKTDQRGKLSTPNLRPTSPNRSIPSSPASIRSSSRLATRERLQSPSIGAVQAAKEALERRTSQNLSSSPLPGKRFM